MKDLSILYAFGLPPHKQPGEALAWSTPSGKRGARISVGVDVGARADMGRLVAQATPRIVILTHDDHDHIGGWDGFAEAGLDTLDELWIPYEWDAVARVAEALAQSVAATPKRPTTSKNPAVSLGALEETLRSGYSAVASDTPRPVDLPAPRLFETVDLAAALSPEQQNELSMSVGYTLRELSASSDDVDTFFDGTAQEVASRAASRASSLMKLMVDAYQRGVTVRLFSVDHVRVSSPWLSAGRAGVATVANAVEVERRPTDIDSLPLLGLALALSVQNKRALCPVLWHRGDLDGGAIVWSDNSGSWVSPRACVDLLPRLLISTAPHHGSARGDHDPAWSALAPFLRRTTSVMLSAGGQWNQQVRPEYATLSTDRKRCTRCRCRCRVPESQTIVLRTNGVGVTFSRGDLCLAP